MFCHNNWCAIKIAHQKRVRAQQGWGQIRICICKYKYKYKYSVFVFVFDQISNYVFVFVFDPPYLVYLTNTFSNTLFFLGRFLNTSLWTTNLHEYYL